MKIQPIALDAIKPYTLNAKQHPLSQLQGIAESLKRFGFKQPVVLDKNNVIVVGHGRIEAAKLAGITEIPCVIADDLTEQEIKAYRLIDNKIAETGWDFELLGLDLDSFEFDFAPFNVEFPQVEQLQEGLTDADECPALPEEPVSKPGDIWLLDKHRVMCGDSTQISDVEKLLNGEKAVLLHADPPYGMGKEKEGVLNDNLTGNKLDQFQLDCWATYHTFLESNASAYIWGNAEALWRLWHVAGLNKAGDIAVRSEIVWSKVHNSGKSDAIGQNSSDMRTYPVASERCLFIVLGKANINNNADNYWDGWESIRGYLSDELKKMEWREPDVNKLTQVKMYSHWFTKSQWTFISKDHYETLQTAATGKAFTKNYTDLHTEYLIQKKIFRGEIKGAFYAERAYFDNTHDLMSDVWTYERVKGEERHGHATPKPVAMMERIIKSSAPKDSLVVEPFGGSGSTLMACEKTQRRCYTMELDPRYCDVIVKRWEAFTGKKAALQNLP
jgi:DNA modification methylase